VRDFGFLSISYDSGDNQLKILNSCRHCEAIVHGSKRFMMQYPIAVQSHFALLQAPELSGCRRAGCVPHLRASSLYDQERHGAFFVSYYLF
jgi:hypothetical protein